MKHARADYDRIQDPLGRIPDNEPVFLLRAQDKHFIAMLQHYYDLVYKDHGDKRILMAVSNHIQSGAMWPHRKAPDM